MNYWLSRDGQKQGPYSLHDLQGMLAGSLAAASDMVWADGMPAWTPLSNVLQPASGLAGGGSFAAAPAGAGALAPKPPSLHWAVVLVLGFVTFGLFPLVWLFVQARFAKKLDPKNKATIQIAGSVVAVMAEFLFVTVNEITIRRGGEGSTAGAANGVLYMFAVFFAVGAIFQIRQALLNHYNKVEPINLRLNPVLSLFFNVYYFQYHLSRIAAWKKTGTLPQR